MTLHSSLLSSLLVMHLAGLSGTGAPADTYWAGVEDVITRCGIPSGFNKNHDGLAAAGPAGNLPLLEPEGTDGSLALVRRQSGLDIVHVIGDTAGWRARRSEADLIDGGSESPPYHLVLNRASGPEHFLFSVAGDGAGELLWSTGDVTAVTDCRPG